MFIKLNNDFGVDRIANPTAPSNKGMTCNWIQTVIAYGYKNGLPADKRRIFATILKKIDVAEHDEFAGFLDLNPVEYAFVQNACALAVVSPQETKAITVIEDAINTATVEIPPTPVDPVIDAEVLKSEADANAASGEVV